MLSQIQMNAAFMAEKRILAGRRLLGSGGVWGGERKGEKMGSRALARPSPEPPHHVVQSSASGLCCFWQK